MLSPKKSPRAVFCRQMKLKIANGDIGEAQRDPWVIVMMFNVTLNNISVISWQSILLVEKSEYPRQTLSHNVVSSTSCHEGDANTQL